MQRVTVTVEPALQSPAQYENPLFWEGFVCPHKRLKYFLLH